MMRAYASMLQTRASISAPLSSDHTALREYPMCSANSAVSRRFRAAVHFALFGTFMIASFMGECAAESIKIVGLGAIDCGQFIKEIDQNPALQRDYLAWAQGLMSGILISRPAGVDEGLDLTPSSFPLRKQLDFLRAYCTQQPAANFEDSVLELYKRLRKQGAP